MRHKGSRRSAAIVLAVAVLLLVVVAAPLVAPDGPAPPPAPAASTAPAPPELRAAPTTEPAPEVRWVESHGVALPVLGGHGPTRLDDDHASGFARTEVGAAVAAAHLLARTSPTAGPEAFEVTLAEQAVGPNQPAMMRAVAQQYEAMRVRAAAPDDAPLPGADAELVGFQLEDFDLTTGTAVVRLVLTSADLRASDRLLETSVSLRWLNDDWRLVAPPNGDWSTTSQVVTTPPPAMLRYDDVA